MTVSNLGHVIGNKVVAIVRTDYDFTPEQVFWTAGVVTLAPLLLLPLVDPARVDAARDARRATDPGAPAPAEATEAP